MRGKQVSAHFLRPLSACACAYTEKLIYRLVHDGSPDFIDAGKNMTCADKYIISMREIACIYILTRVLCSPNRSIGLTLYCLFLVCMVHASVIVSQFSVRRRASVHLK